NCFSFSSRRRHTRFSRDWSSDVCSSDLGAVGQEYALMSELVGRVRVRQQAIGHSAARGECWRQFFESEIFEKVLSLLISNEMERSEERRVGKECRSRWS